MKKLFGIIALLSIVLSLTYTGCRKGEEDPFLSLRSRDKRIIGTWTLKSSSEVITTNTTETDYNNKNSEKTTEAESKSESMTFDGTVFTNDETKTITTTTLTTEPSLNAQTGKYSYNTTTAVVVVSTNIINKKTYSVELEISEDHTYKATIAETITSFHYSGKQNVGGIDYPYTTIDTTYSPADVRTWIDEGDWYWEDAKDKKIMIVAGNVMNGKLKRLSNKEVILEDITEESDDKTENFTVGGIFTYNNPTNQDSITTGVKTNHVVKSISRNYTATWEAKK
ncbi:MAG: hypothetical protein A2046_00380 [Bacteroidetes bacterium GWA2_30_7]|nr:MAG: hypothetical protein A2046_00380 [Bacteroidetes bacterium GWA2_30_7]